MNPLYVIAAIVGTGLVLASLVGALDDAGIGPDHDLQLGSADDLGATQAGGADHGVSHALLPFLSLRFWVFAVAAFGLIGVALSAVDAGSPATRFLAAGLGGLATGTAVWMLFRLTGNVATGDDASASHLVGHTALVVVAVHGATPGKIRMQVKGQTVEMLATTAAGTTLVVGQQAVVVDLVGTGAKVIALSDFASDPSTANAVSPPGIEGASSPEQLGPGSP